MVFQVELHAFLEGKVRTVVVSDEELIGVTEDEVLERVFHYGQNDFQPQRLPSVSVGDVIFYKGKRFRVVVGGFEKLLGGDKQ